MDGIRASIIIVSYNTKGLLRRCFDAIRDSAGGIAYEIIVVDNQSRDGSAEFIRERYPEITLIESGGNIGFAAANNLGVARARGEYLILLNTDAFFVGDAFRLSVELMDRRPEVGLAGARLTSESGGWQPSARMFPCLLNDFLSYTALPRTRPGNRLFGRADMTWRDQGGEILCDWVPGAFSIIRKSIIDKIGFFDPRFFFYLEEVDLCRRIKKEGWKIAYWPQLRVIHLVGASKGEPVSDEAAARATSRMDLWRLQSRFLYYRKHHGALKAFASRVLEASIFAVKGMRNRKKDPATAAACRRYVSLVGRAWKNTDGGRTAPAIPWGDA